MSVDVDPADVRLLLVEDDEDIRESLTAALEERGYPVEVAENGLEALDKLRSGCRPAVILLDLMLPVMDGWAFRSELLQDPELAGIPVIVLSAAASYWGTPERVSARFSKPFDLPALILEIDRCAAPTPR